MLVNRLPIVFACLATRVLLDAALVHAEDSVNPADAVASSAIPEKAGEPTAEELARQDQNPITRFYVMRFEDNVQVGVGPHDEAVNFFRFQPLVPLKLGKDWTLLTRFIVPLVHQPWPETNDGLGDISINMFAT